MASLRFTRCGVFISVALLTSAFVGATSSSATTRHLVVKPSTGLTNGKAVRVTGSGFKPHAQIFLVECLAKAAGQSDCDITTATPATISAKGILKSSTFKVTTGKVGTGSCGTKPANLKNCVINAGSISGTDTATAPITFKAPKH